VRATRRFFSAGSFGLVGLFALGGLGACGSNDPLPQEQLGSTSSPIWVNGDFEGGAAGVAPPSWTLTPYLNPGVTFPPVTRADLKLAVGGSAQTVTVLNGTPAADPLLGTGASLRVPRFGTKAAYVNMSPGNNRNVNSLKQTMTLAAGDVDSADGKIHVRFAVAPVLQNPSHPAHQQPYYWVQLRNLTTGATLYQDFNASAQPGVPWKISGTYYYTDWQVVDITSTSTGTLAVGDQVELEVIAAGCSLGGHTGRVYVDGVGPTIPGLFVTAAAPATTAPSASLTYTLTYRNGGTTSATGVVVEFNTPPDTTYASLSAAGLTCTAPAAGATGKVSCTVPGTFAAGALGTFTVTVNVNAATALGTVITAGNYDVLATGYSPLIGPKVKTTVVCNADSQCATGNWCNIAGGTCSPKLSNGTSMPTDTGHTTPVIDGSCSTAAATLVCTSAVCDTSDSKCGYAVGTGPCTTATAATVCRSGACSTGGKCMPAGGCNVDGDCSGGNWCNITAHVCAPKLSNGTAMPTDAPHTSPTLNGSCTTAAATLVCTSAVCDTTDSKCGYANGTGPCTTVTAATVCRSATCASDGKCMPVGGCNVDADCTGGNWCTISTHTCTAKLGNGTALPTDAPHTSPTLNGACTTAAATLVCVSAVCDAADNKCGYANGNGSCTALTSSTVCRSGSCGADGKCGLANGEGTCNSTTGPVICRSAVCDADGKCGLADGSGVCSSTTAAVICRSGKCSSTKSTCVPATGGCAADADCASAEWCNLTALTCAPKVTNGNPVPTDGKHTSPTLDGKCSGPAATLTCVSGVCDTRDDKCGYDNGGDSACTSTNAAVVCRSGTCSATGKCIAASTCLVDADCPMGWCNISDKKCAPKVDNGNALPPDPGHTSPVLDGKCNPDAGALVCKSAACDKTDDKCGLVNGTPCVAGEDAKCRAGVCFAADSKCGKPIGETCATAGECRSAQCTDGKCDADTDGDGVSDVTEKTLGTDPNDKDSDHDGILDNVELTADRSGKGPFSKVDTDGDGKIDALDDDDDNDTLLTKDELGSGGSGSPLDTDGDGKPNYLDEDDDNDTIPTKKEVADGKDPKVSSDDVDGDGSKNWLDTDSDGDGFADKDESSDVNGDAIPDYLQKSALSGPLTDDGTVEGGGCNAGRSTGSTSTLALVALGALLAVRRKQSR